MIVFVGLHDVGFSDRPAQPHLVEIPQGWVRQSSDPLVHP